MPEVRSDRCTHPSTVKFVKADVNWCPECGAILCFDASSAQQIATSIAMATGRAPVVMEQFGRKMGTGAMNRNTWGLTTFYTVQPLGNRHLLELDVVSRETQRRFTCGGCDTGSIILRKVGDDIFAPQGDDVAVTNRKDDPGLTMAMPPILWCRVCIKQASVKGTCACDHCGMEGTGRAPWYLLTKDDDTHALRVREHSKVLCTRCKGET